MSILERVQSVAENLTRAEHLLVREIIAKPRDVALGTASSLAQRTGVHEATASRLAKKLGFDSYAGFRDAIRDEFIVKADPAMRVRNTLEAARDGDILGELIAREIEALTALPTYVDSARISQAARLLTGARRVFIFARGNAATLSVMLERRLLRMGVDVETLSGDGRDLAEQILGLGADDVMVSFVFRRQPRLYAALIDRAHRVGARTIAVSGSIGPALAPAPSLLLSAPRSGSNDSFQTLTVPMAITNALVLTMAQMNRETTLERLETLGQLISDFESR
ncbi:MurR/RpiR family transcriptional regulator [Pelagibacterium halotolerans]|uniref:Transcriptional regulator n=1 Tax=Pelagibacterium halotolerans (strain DSM 22347 / JCM 15775 / CGMCC 1.7692 / B2) TaxID=1082931 RepID=G4RD45_PELHB|nr:MurR/RpiR family transcriptional regulator [Pelagibacterium halotolerans]AEQ53795.1 transcriptional regulator [Pelagibacterium halotolerans B2]QJR20048.1 MurR/RpiR family transcriptional regulator [Pelagibacterium halotolerans]SEA81175.1 transcriptional regulator, RpiR family [Pelagibacterium halotolerans]